MAVYNLSVEAANDIASIYEYSIEQFGLKRAGAYMADMQDRFQSLANNPSLGRDASELVSGIRRFVSDSHVIFYAPTDNGILVVRVLNQSMDFEQHL